MNRSFRVRGAVCLVAAFVFSCSFVCMGAEWNGYEKRDFVVGERSAFLIVPKAPAAGNPWIWRTEFFGHEPQADLALLSRGFHVAYLDVQNLYGAPIALDAMDGLYLRATTEFRLSPKVVLEGFSRGGLFALNWGARNPRQVSCIYNDAPVCDFKSWPGGKGKSKGSSGDWERAKSVYGFANDAEALAYRFNPVDNLESLAKAKVPLLHVCGETDDVVPIDENSRLIEQRYRQLGGPITLIVKPNCNHHPHSLKDPTRIVNFVLTHTGFADQVTEPQTPYGYDYFVLRGGLANCRFKFEHEKIGRVAFLGGSITAAPGWRDQVCDDLKKRFPETKFDFVNAGISSLGSTPGAFRLDRDVLKRGRVDLLFEEAAVNDDTNEFSDIEQVRGMEGIVRKARLANPKMDIVLLHFVDPGKIEQINRGEIPAVIRNHERVAERYVLPSINLAREVAERIHAGEFSWEKDFRDLHPAPFGHNLYAKSVARLFDAAWSGAAIQPAATPLPEPVDGNSYFRGVLISADEAIESKAVTIESGWKLISNWAPTDGKGTRDGFVNVPVLAADDAGAALKYRFNGRSIGIFVASGPDAGEIDFRIDGGEWRTQELFTRWSSSLHLPWAKMLATGLEPKEHVVEMKVSNEASPSSTGHSVRIVFLLVDRSE